MRRVGTFRFTHCNPIELFLLPGVRGKDGHGGVSGEVPLCAFGGCGRIKCGEFAKD